MAGTEEANAPWSKGNASAFETKQMSKYFDPCQEAATRSIKCLQRNAGDKEMCQDYFEAYRDCKKQWVEQRRTGKLPNQGQ